MSGNNNIPIPDVEPLDQYQVMLHEEFFTSASRARIMKLALYQFKKKYGTTPPVADWMINWAMDDTIADRNRWKQTFQIHNLQIWASQRLVERMEDMDYDTNLNWFDVQTQKRDITSIPSVCGSHFTDRIKYRSPNIL
uniref:Uncharacterized protein n=1 Tax=viral metagenome TaxID=1070528 RepID=A0A6C0JRT0_9ZZZZ